MAAIVPYLLLSGGFAAVLCGFAWLGRRIRRRGAGGTAAAAGFAAWEEAFKTTSHAAYVEVQQQSKRKAPLESPDGDPRRRLRLRLRLRQPRRGTGAPAFERPFHVKQAETGRLEHRPRDGKMGATLDDETPLRD